MYSTSLPVIMITSNRNNRLKICQKEKLFPPIKSNAMIIYIIIFIYYTIYTNEKQNKIIFKYNLFNSTATYMK